MHSAREMMSQALKAGEKGQKKDGIDYGLLYRNRLIEFRRENDKIVRLEKPTNLDRAHQLGWKAKKGFLVARVAIRKGGGLHRRPYRGRRPKQMGMRKRTRGKSIQAMAEMRTAKKFPNCEVLNSYWIGKDGKHEYFEVILIDTSAPEILSDRGIKWIASSKHHGRAARGLTFQGKKSRGQIRKGIGTEKNRPSMRSKKRQAK